MANYTITYIMYTPGHRHHHANSQTNIISPASGTGTSFPAIGFSSLPNPANGILLPFAFMSITGAESVNGVTGSNFLFTSPGTEQVTVGTANVNVLVVYAPEGIGPGGLGVWVDAFNVNTGNFSDSDFMSVKIGSVVNAADTAEANNNGDVSSVAPVKDLVSYATVDGVPFKEWQAMGGTPANTVTNIDYTLGINQGGLVFAFYQSPPIKEIPRPAPECAQLLATIHQYTADYNAAVKAWNHIGPVPNNVTVLAADLQKWNAEYLASGCLFPVTPGSGGTIPKVPKP